MNATERRESHAVPGHPRPLSVAINGWFLGQSGTGSGQYLGRLLCGLLDRTTDDLYTVFTPESRGEGRPTWPAADRVRVVPLATPWDRRSPDVAKLWFEQITFPAACRRAGADLAHVPYWGTPAWTPIPTVTTVHDLIPRILPAYRGSWLARGYTRLVSHTVRHSACILTDSHSSADDIRRLLGVPPARLRTIYLAVEDCYQPMQDSADGARRLDEVRERYALPPRFVLYLGGFDQRKNVGRLMRAYGQLRRESPAAPPLVLAGRLPERESPLFTDPRREAARQGIEAEVRCIGWVAEGDKPALYALATCFVFPSLYEGFGFPVLEAMSCGTPVVTSRGSSLAELAGAGGLLVDPTSEDDIAAGIRTLLHDAPRREQMGRAALAQARQFRWDETARLTRAAYLDCV
jgi:glycosyltransferase involved in cell wall biosynthesis